MDTFFEQIVAIKKTAKKLMIIIGILLAATIVSFLLYLFVTPFIGFASFLLIYVNYCYIYIFYIYFF